MIVAAAIAWSLSDLTWPSVLLWFAACLPVVVAVFAAVPQIMFKPWERTLHLTPDGWSTTIGRKSGSMSWKVIRSVATTPDGLLIVGVSGNAMIVPGRAFDGEAHREAIMADVRRWYSAARAQ
ncbi:YcxB family protein [Luteibacter pinisoli]|uniref:YcxB family protein n=1 Tax=Luteibacter pinisoli TaxID=2589080 RepID=A0A4Y5YZQ8_9GAMM|nr:YcxB family protein [Luteibacter pinisoli]QDE38287.1 YcxB family protein [Luteibacter pinisoli]